MIFTLAWRNIWRHPRRTVITISSIVFAVLSAVAVESLERGAQDQMVENMARFHTGFLQLQHPEYRDEPSLDHTLSYHPELRDSLVATHPSVDLLNPRIETFMLAAGERQTRGAMVLGIDPDAEQQLNQLQDRLVRGRFIQSGGGHVVIGEGLAERLEISIGDSLVLYGQGRFGQTAAGLFPVSGLLRLPLREMNQQMVYLSLENAQWLLSADDQVTSILITPATPSDQEEVTTAIRTSGLANFRSLRTWQEMNPELLRALEFDKLQTRFMMMVLYVIIGFGLFGTILTMTLERAREFGVLLSIGLQRRTLAFIVWIESLWIGMTGVLAGSVLGLLLVLYFRKYPIELSDEMAEVIISFGFEPVLPVALEPDIFLWQATVIFLMSLLISLYPIHRIFRMNILGASKKGGR